jgi:hypothetical protein
VEKKKFYSEEEMAIKLISILYRCGEIGLEVYQNVIKHYAGQKSMLP